VVDVDDLVTFREIEQLKYRYCRSLDHKDWDAFTDCFEPDATASYGERLEFAGRDDITAYMRENLGPSMITVHQVHHPEITVDGDIASAVWSLQDRVIMTEYRFLLDGVSFYRDRYVRGADGAWRIAHTGYERIYEAMISFDDVPSFNLTANKWA
jgi:hypothetical protein